MANAKIVVDLRARTFEIEVSEERLDEVLTKIESFFDRHADLASQEIRRVEPEATPVPALHPSTGAQSTPAVAQKSQRGKGKTNNKAPNWRLVELGLSGEQINSMRTFYTGKSPATQNDSVATVAVKLKEFLGRESFSGDEIHSALKLVNKPTPRNLVAVFSNMKKAGIAGTEGGSLVANSYLDDYVAYRMKTKIEMNG